jgi:ABC-2 type transport system permease protein
MWKFIKHEWMYWLKSPMLWIFLFINALMIFGAVSSDNITIGGGVGSVHKNAPYIIQNYYGLMSLICLLMTTAFMNASAGRDFQYNMYQLVFSAPIKKSHYFFGKFIGAITMAAIPLLGVSIGTLLGPLMPWVQPERYGDVIWSGHLWGFLGFALPNVIISGVLLFSLAIIFRNNIVSFVGAMAILVFYLVAGGLMADIKNEWVANLIDPFGFRPFSTLTKYMTVDEKNVTAIPLVRQFLFNRMIWMGFSLVLLFVLYFRFSFNTKKEKIKKQKQKVVESTFSVNNKVFSPDVANKISFKLLRSFTWFEIKTVVKNPTFIIILLIGAINLITSLTSFTGRYGADQYPVTYEVIETIRNSFSIFLIAIITFYTGVVVWKERDAKMHEIQDAAAVKTGLLFTSKLLAITFCVAIVLLLMIVIGVITQTLYGYTNYKLDVYFKYLLIYTLVNYFFLIIISLFFHYTINNRYIAYFAFILFVILNSFIWDPLEISTNLVKYGETGRLTYSDMNGFGPFVKGNLWFSIYWFIFSVLVAIVAYAFYVRGKELGISKRLEYAKNSLRKNKWSLGLFSVLFVICGAYIYYNTLMLNQVSSADETERIQVNYEKLYKKYEGKIQPKIYKLNYNIELFASERNMNVKVTESITNRSNEAISEFYFTLPTLKDSVLIEIPNAKMTLNDKASGFRIYKLSQPLKPNDSMEIKVTNTFISKGFENEVSFTQVNANGSFFNNMDILPIFGYFAEGEIRDKNKRKKLDLPLRIKSPKLSDGDLKARMRSYISQDADWVNVTTTISTDADQTAIAPGSLVKSWTEGNRKYFNYQLDKASLNFYSFLSARYEVERKKWNGIDIEVYYDKQHAMNVPNMVKSIEKSLEYYTKNFGPYYHKQVRIIEFPRYSGFAQAFPGTMPYSESIGFITDLRDVKKDDIDFVYYVVAHEMGHQYWAHQLIGPKMQGSEWMSEGFAQYSALMVMEKEYGKDKMKTFLEYEMNGYLSGRSGEFEAERPLFKTEGQGYIHYQKASVAMYYLKEMIGEDKVNSAMKSLIDSFAYAPPPYPTANAVLAAFRKVTPDTLQYVLTDLFENITIFSNRITDVSAQKVGDEYEVTIKATCEKFYADSLGKEKAIPLNDYLNIGIFAASTNKKVDLGKALVMQKVKITKKDNTFTFKTKELPDKAGIDPYNYLIDRISNDNVKRVN